MLAVAHYLIGHLSYSQIPALAKRHKVEAKKDSATAQELLAKQVNGYDEAELCKLLLEISLLDSAYQRSTTSRDDVLADAAKLTFSADKGLLAVSALGKDVPTNVFGEEVHSQFLELRAALSKIYGDPSLTADEVQAGSIWNDPQDWMMGLLKKERSVVSIWNLKSAPVNHIAMIIVRGAVLSQEKGYNSVKYEFEGFEAFTDAQKDKVDSNF